MSLNDEVKPPSYEEVAAGGSKSNAIATRTLVQSDVHNELWNLAIQFNSIQEQVLQELQIQDEQVLNFLIPYVKNFLVNYSRTTLPKATLIIIPSGAVSSEAVPCDGDLRSTDNFVRIIKIANEKGEDKEIWTGELMAKRLASYLRPCGNESSKSAGKSESPQVEPTSTKRRFWRKNPTPGEPLDYKNVDLPKVSMDVNAEEVVFRTQSLLGLYETQSVWGIVIKICVNVARGP